MSADYYNSLLTLITELKSENSALLQNNNILKHEIEKITSIYNGAKQPSGDLKLQRSELNNTINKLIFNGDMSILIEEYRSGNFQGVLKNMINCLTKDSNEYWEAIKIEYRWNNIQDYKMRGIFDAHALIVQENKLSESALSLIRRIEEVAPNTVKNDNAS
ncbi:MAG: hypothetical protein ACKV1O_21535 [Saprospiraceae bacterium]